MNYSKMTKKELVQIVEEKEGAKLSVDELKKQLEKLQRQNEILQLARKEDKEKVEAGEQADEKLKSFIDVHNKNLQELAQQYTNKLEELTEFYENKTERMNQIIEEQNRTVIMLFDLIDASHEMQQKHYENFKSLIISDTKEN